MKLALASAIVGLAACAGGASAQKVEFGLMLGAGMSTFSGADAGLFRVSERAARGAGIGLAISTNDRVTVRPELLYLLKGAGVAPDSGISGTYGVTYLQVPVLVDVYLPVGGPSTVRPRVFAGPAISLAWSCSWHSKASSGSYRCDPQYSAIGGSDFGAVVGAGLDLPLGRVKGTFEGRYDLGLSDVAQGAGVLRNRAFIVFAGISLPLHPTIIPPDSI